MEEAATNLEQAHNESAAALHAIKHKQRLHQPRSVEADGQQIDLSALLDNKVPFQLIDGAVFNTDDLEFNEKEVRQREVMCNKNRRRTT